MAYVFATAGQTVDYVLGDVILPQLEADAHGADVAAETGMLLMPCDRCAAKRGLAEFDRTDDHGRDRFEPTGTVEGAIVGYFPDLYDALDGAGVD